MQDLGGLRVDLDDLLLRHGHHQGPGLGRGLRVLGRVRHRSVRGRLWLSVRYRFIASVVVVVLRLWRRHRRSRVHHHRLRLRIVLAGLHRKVARVHAGHHAAVLHVVFRRGRRGLERQVVEPERAHLRKPGLGDASVLDLVTRDPLVADEALHLPTHGVAARGIVGCAPTVTAHGDGLPEVNLQFHGVLLEPRAHELGGGLAVQDPVGLMALLTVPGGRAGDVELVHRIRVELQVVHLEIRKLDRRAAVLELLLPLTENDEPHAPYAQRSPAAVGEVSVCTKLEVPVRVMLSDHVVRRGFLCRSQLDRHIVP
mmetsp:Transcript_4500/g.8329  ORF Transcript_4500/g.8329 Transcript_4500/m.8329 type:complete len:312 (+) Transcript_4500:620-1555(+)